jgi:hypothetical protein
MSRRLSAVRQKRLGATEVDSHGLEVSWHLARVGGVAGEGS